MSTSPPKKRPRSKTLSADSKDGLPSVGRHTLEGVQTYLSNLRTVPADLESFTDPSKCTSILFPSLLRSSIPSLHAPTGQYTYHHMGRPIFQTILTEVQRLDRQISPPLVLLGTHGAGKTHLLATLASYLFVQGKRVVFLPETSSMADDVVFCLKLAFALAFADLPQTMQRILQFKTHNEFLEFSHGCREDIYFLVDGLDQVESDLKATISALASSHFHICTAYTLGALRGASSIRISSGLSSSELTEWLRHFESQMPKDINALNILFMNDFLGAIPFFLRLFFEFRGELYSDIIIKYRGGREIHGVADNITAFDENIENLTSAEKSRYHTLMSACLTETIPEIRSGSNPTLWDPRYFYFDDDGRGHCNSGLARDIIIPLLRLKDLHLFATDAWYSGARCGTGATRDSAIAQICLTRIGSGGLTQADAQGNAMRICIFRQNPIFGWMFEEAWKSPRGMSSFLCIPGSEVCKFLNAVILRINPSDKTAHLIPLQITTSLTCSDMATLFFAVTWHKWESAIKEEGFKVINTFVCVDSLTAESANIRAKSAAFRDKVKFVSPEYTVRSLNVAMLDPKLGRILLGEKYQSPPA
ncbi:hypothetical protein C8R43DRAFT_997926 [Mycena crocata]|nr:hypothetical protein C8R43DRAFT_997926 [Mycena crocata]